MLRSLLTVVFFFFSQVSLASQNYSVGVNGVGVVGQSYDVNSSRILPMHKTKGTTIGLSVYLEDGGVISFDDEHSELKTFNDDQGNTLLVKGVGLQSTRFGFTPQISKDKKMLFIEVETPAIPSKGSSSLKLEGNLVLTSAHEEKNVELKKQKLIEGSTLQLGSVVYTISDIKQLPETPSKLRLTIQTNQNDDLINKIYFHDEAGEIIESYLSAIGKTGGQEDSVTERVYTLSTNSRIIQISYAIWLDLKRQTLPFAVEVSLGL